jgi:NTE family protein
MPQDEHTPNPSHALALSGGGYRATLFSLGSLIRLNELGLLQRMNRITGVSGGAITLGQLASSWSQLKFSEHGVALNFDEIVSLPLQKFCAKSLDVKAGLKGLFSPLHTIGDKIAKGYDQGLFHGKKLDAIPTGKGIPEFVFYATSYETGSSVRITSEELYDYKLGSCVPTGMTIAQAVGASSAFPPIFSPVKINASRWDWRETDYSEDYQLKHYRKKLVLCDGGLYDNLGIEAIWKKDPESKDHFDRVFVCDAGAPLSIGFDSKSGFLNGAMRKLGVKRNWVSQLSRMSAIMIEQQRALRKRALIDNFIAADYAGTYWGIASRLRSYDNDSAIAADGPIVASLAQVPTRLKAFKPRTRGRLVNWGYAIASAAIHKHIKPDFEPDPVLPLPQFPLLPASSNHGAAEGNT